MSLPDIHLTNPTARVELYELDTTLIGGSVLRFHAGTNELGQPVTWNGQQYDPMPIQATGFAVTTQGSLPRPKLRVANVGGALSQILSGVDITGCKLTRIVTFARYLDAVNFAGGNPNADPVSELPRDIYYIDHKVSEQRAFVEFELASSLDLSGVMLPARQIIQNACPWKYRGAECGYSGGAIADIMDNPTADPQVDACGKRLASCKLRFGETAVLPYGGFPAAGLVRP